MNKGKPKVSIIITCFNLGQYLDEAINSCLNQVYGNIEIIVINDGSTEEETIQVLKGWENDNRVRVINIPNGGVANARNYGIKESSGKYICCLDADDKIDPQYISKAVKIFEDKKDDEGLGIVTCWVQRFGNDKGVWEVQPFNKVEMLWSNSIPIASVFSRELFEKVGGYDQNIDSHEDWDFWISAVAKGYRWDVIEEKLFFYRVRDNSKITKGNKKRLEYMKYMMKKHKTLYERKYLDLVLTLEKERLSSENFVKEQEFEIAQLKKRIRRIKMKNSFLGDEKEEFLNKIHSLENKEDRSKYKCFYFLKKKLRNTYKIISFLFVHVKSSGRRVLFNIANVEVLSLDVFDTLVRRDVHPEEIKLATAQYVSLRFNEQLNDISNPDQIYRERLEVEREIFLKQGDYKLRDVLTKLLEKLNVDINFVQDIYDYEISLERKVLRKDTGIEKFLGKLLEKERKYFLSDFYITKEQLKPLINKFFPELRKGYVSCDLNKTKASGELFEEFLKKEKIQPPGLLHIGDSKHSDVDMAKNKGINSLRYFNLKEELKRREWSDKRDIRNFKFPYEKDIEERLNRVQVPDNLSKKQGILFNLGAKYAPIFYGFVLNILESASKEELDKVYYFTREGVFFRDIHEKILENRSYLEIQPEILGVSRVSTFFVSLKDFDKENLQRMWSQYKEQTPKSFFKSLGIPLREVKEYLDKYGIDINRVSSLSSDSKFSKLLKDCEFVNYISQVLEKRKGLFSDYLTSKGLANDEVTYMVVDIGWRGSIQDNIAYFLENAKIIGKYLGLHSGYYKAPLNTRKSAYGPNYKDDSERVLDIVNWTGVWEMLTNSPMGSVHGYKKEEGGITTEEKINEYETRVHNEYIKYFQMGALAAIKELDEFVEVHAITSKELRPYVLNLMKELVYKPEHILTEAYFNLNHNETFGLGEFTNMAELAKLNKKDLLKIFFSRSSRKNFYNTAVKTCWRNGYWEYNKINGIMNSLVRLRYRLTHKL